MSDYSHILDAISDLLNLSEQRALKLGLFKDKCKINSISLDDIDREIDRLNRELFG